VGLPMPLMERNVRVAAVRANCSWVGAAREMLSSSIGAGDGGLAGLGWSFWKCVLNVSKLAAAGWTGEVLALPGRNRRMGGKVGDARWD
jgi:hypothetical protein